MTFWIPASLLILSLVFGIVELVRQRRTPAKIDEGLATSLAGQVSAGLTPGEGQEERMYGALVAIGLMVRNASDSQIVQDTLDLIDRSQVTEHGNGVTRIETRMTPDDAS